MKKATIRDVANMGGVSVSTVSRVLSESGYIAKETKGRVMDAVETLKYTPNTAARSLRCEKSKSIGVVLPGISIEFYAACASAILREASRRGYTVLFAQSGHNPDGEEDVLRALLARCVDGVLFIGDNNDDSVIYGIHHRDVPVVTGDRKLCGIPSVTFQNRETMHRLVKSCCAYGCKKLVYVGSTPDYMNNLSERYRGFLDAVNGVEGVHAEYVFEDRVRGNILEGSYVLFRDRIACMRPDAVITSTDKIAQGILRAAHDTGVRVPQDMIVTGFDDMSSAAYLVPSLTTIRQDVKLFADKCLSMLEALMGGHAVQSCVLEQEIIVRESAPIMADSHE